jgi:hypothetical protein
MCSALRLSGLMNLFDRGPGNSQLERRLTFRMCYCGAADVCPGFTNQSNQISQPINVRRDLSQRRKKHKGDLSINGKSNSKMRLKRADLPNPLGQYICKPRRSNKAKAIMVCHTAPHGLRREACLSPYLRQTRSHKLIFCGNEGENLRQPLVWRCGRLITSP